MSVAGYSSGGVLEEYTPVTFSPLPTNSALSTQRYFNAYTMSNGSTAYANLTTLFQYASGQAVNFTLRIGMPQLENAGYATSVIPTSTSAVTRASDNFTVPTTAAGTNGAWYTAGIGTFGATGIFSDAAPLPSLGSINDGTSNNAIGLYIGTTNYAEHAKIEVGGTAKYSQNSSTGAYTLGNLTKQAIAYQVNNVNAAEDGALLGLSTSVSSIPTVTTLSVGSVIPGSNGILDGWVRHIWYMPTREPDAALAQTYTQ